MSNLGPASTYRNRQPKGRPIGGQFASTEHGEAGISLDALSPAGVDIMAIAQDAAMFWQDRYGQKRKSNVIDAEDIAQATLVEVLKAVKAGKPITNMRQFVNSVAANLTVRAVERFRPENQRARRLLEAKKDRFQEVNKRQPTPTEEKALIEEVNAEWLDPRHKPSSDWHIPDKINASLDKPVFDDGSAESTLGARLVAFSDVDDAPEPGSSLERFLELMDDKGAASKAEASRLMWNGLAELNDAPLAVAGSLSQRQVTKHRAVMDEFGVAKACKDWNEGEQTAAMDALFAPFGELGIKEEEQVVQLFERFQEPEAAMKIWKSAVAFANTKHAGA